MIVKTYVLQVSLSKGTLFITAMSVRSRQDFRYRNKFPRNGCWPMWILSASAAIMLIWMRSRIQKQTTEIGAPFISKVCTPRQRKLQKLLEIKKTFSLYAPIKCEEKKVRIRLELGDHKATVIRKIYMAIRSECRLHYNRNSRLMFMLTQHLKAWRGMTMFTISLPQVFEYHVT